MNRLIIEWLKERNLIEGSTSKDQLCKLVQEVGEVSDAICKNEVELLKSEIGDCIVVLTAIAEQNGLTIEDCIYTAYNKIKDRKGVMKDGIFIKEEDILTTYREPKLVANLRKIDNKAADALLALSSDKGLSIDLYVPQLGGSLIWKETPQGHDYWEYLDGRLRKEGYYD